MDKTLFLILSHNRCSQLSNMIESIEKFTDPNLYQLVICDSASTELRTKEYLKKLEYKYRVIRHDSNMIFESFNEGLKMLGDRKHFILSDPDIILNSSIPSDWISLMVKFLESTTYPKVGFSLDPSFVPYQKIHDMKSIYDNEMSMFANPIWSDLFQDNYYEVPTDTTLAMYRLDTYSYWSIDGSPSFKCNHRENKIIGQNSYNKKYEQKNPMNCARVGSIGGKWIARHTGWEMATNPRYRMDYLFYRSSIINGNTNGGIASTMGFMK